MSDAIINRFVARGTAAERAAFTPDPPTGGPDPSHLYVWYETDTGKLWVWDGADWDHVATSGGTGGADVSGPSSSTDHALTRWDGITGKVVQDSPGTALDDAGRLTVKALRIPMFDAGNSGASKTIDWDDGNEQLLTLTDDAALTLDNPTDGGRYVLILATGAGGFAPTWPASVLWPGGVTPTITTDPDRWDLITLIYLAGAGVYLASINQDYDNDAS